LPSEAIIADACRPNIVGAMDQGDKAPIVADAEQGAEWIAEAMRASGYSTDFSPASLWEIDGFFDEQMKRPGKPKRRGLLAEQRGARLFAIGAYVGEVIRRNSEGWEWIPAAGNPDDEIDLRLVCGEATIWPVRSAMKRFAEGVESGIATYGVAAADLAVGPRPG
jgi:hypothetical protein